MISGTVAAIFSVVSAVATVASGIVSFIQQSAAADRQERLRKEELAAQAAGRDLQRRRELARLERDARARRAQLVNTLASRQQTTGTASAAERGAAAIEAARRREAGFIDAQEQINEQIDDITRRSIEADASIARQNALTTGFNTVVGGITDLAGAATNFPTGDTEPNPIRTGLGPSGGGEA